MPIRDMAGSIVSIEFIDEAGRKPKLSGGKVQGCFWSTSIDLPDGDGTGLTLGVCEGVATTQTYTIVTGNLGIAGLSSGNMKSICQQFRTRYPKAIIHVVGDLGNGFDKAVGASELIDGTLITPDFSSLDTRGNDLNDLFCDYGGVEVIRRLLENAKEKVPLHTKMFTSIKDLMSNQQPVEYLIDDYLEIDTFGQMFGESGGGKSFIALDMSLSIANGQRWNGKECKQGIVLYLAGEGKNGIARRATARLANGLGCKGGDLILLSNYNLNMAEETCRDVITAGRELEKLHNNKVVLIVIDTLARHIDGDENSTRDMTDFVNMTDQIRAAFDGCVSMIVHHSGNGEDTKNRSRGNSSLKAACDFEMKCSKGELSFTKMKDSELPKAITFKLVPVLVGKTVKGEDVTSCYVQYGEKSFANKQPEKQAEVTLTKEELTVFQIIEKEPNGAHIAVTRDKYIKHKTSFDSEIKLNSVRKTFRDCLESLSFKKKIIVDSNSIVRGLKGTLGDFLNESPPFVQGTPRDSPYIGESLKVPQSPLSENGTATEPEKPFFLAEGFEISEDDLI